WIAAASSDVFPVVRSTSTRFTRPLDFCTRILKRPSPVMRLKRAPSGYGIRTLFTVSFETCSGVSVTQVGVAIAVPQTKTTATVNIARVIAPLLYHFVIVVWRTKEAESAA